MSLRTLLIWCIIAGLLGGGAVFVRNQQAQASQSTKAEWAGLEFDPASITSLKLDEGDSSVVVERDASSIDEWLGTWSEGDSGFSWNVSSTRVRGALRSLSTTQVRLSEEQLVETGSIIQLESRSGSSISITLSDDQAGGRTPVRIERRDESGAIERILHGWVESSVANALTIQSTQNWRDTKLMSVPLSSVDRVSVQAGAYATQLGLINGRWQIESPIAITAERSRVDELVGTMLGLSAQRFVDDPVDDATTGLSSPIATIELGASGDEYRLVIGQRADVGGDSLYAQFSKNGAPTLIQISIEALSKLTAVPDAYISNTAGSFALTDARSIRVLNKDGESKFEPARQSDTWVEQYVRVDTLSEDAINRMLVLLTQSPANVVRLLEPDFELPKPIGGLEILDSQLTPLASYSVAIEQSDQGIRLLIMQTLDTGHHVVWAYLGEDAQATATWLTLTAGRSG